MDGGTEQDIVPGSSTTQKETIEVQQERVADCWKRRHTGHEKRLHMSRAYS